MTFTIDGTNIATLLAESGETAITDALMYQAYKRQLLRFVSVSKRLKEVLRDHPGYANFAACFDFLSKCSVITQKKIIGYPSFQIWIRAAQTAIAKFTAGDDVSSQKIAIVCDDFVRFALAAAACEGVDIPFRAQLPNQGEGRIFLSGAHLWLEVEDADAGDEHILVTGGKDGNFTPSLPSGKKHLCGFITKHVPVLNNGVEVNCWESGFQILAQHDYRDFDTNSAQVDDWLRSLHDACDLISTCQPALYNEITRYVRVLMPIVPPDPLTSVSSTSAAAHGLLWLSLNSNTMTIAETLVHEFHHQKLNTLMLFDPVITGPTKQPIFYSPWRNDARPLFGILHGAFAFGGVLEFYNRVSQCEIATSTADKISERLHLLRSQVLQALDTLGREANFSTLGRSLYEAMRKHAEWLPTHSLSETGAQRVKDYLSEHRRRWLTANESAPLVASSH